VSSISGEALDDIVTEVADSIYLPFSRTRSRMRFGDYTVELVIRIADRRPECESFRVNASHEGTAVTAAALRTIPLASLVEQAFVGIGFPFRFDGDKRVPVTTQSVIDGPRSSPRESRDTLLPKVVDAYREALADPNTRSAPTQAVADRLHFARGYVSRLLSEARRMNPPLLGPASAGKPGEEPPKDSKK
jgi:hypothetical protein